MEQEQQGDGTGGRTGAVWDSRVGECKIEEETDTVGEEYERRAGETNGEEIEGLVELVIRGVEEELEGRQTGEGDGEELQLYLTG